MKGYTMKQIARAAGVRTSLIRKYVREGVRGTHPLVADESGRVTLFNLRLFSTQHFGRARLIARRAITNLAGAERREAQEERAEQQVEAQEALDAAAK